MDYIVSTWSMSRGIDTDKVFGTQSALRVSQTEDLYPGSLFSSFIVKVICSVFAITSVAFVNNVPLMFKITV